jgi:hypothetical protein
MRRSLLVVAASCLAAAAAVADDLPAGIGVVAPNGSVFTADIGPSGDSDNYLVAGFPGTPLIVVVRAKRGSLLAPDVVVFRPDGSLFVSDVGGLVVVNTKSSATARCVMDATGVWTVRVSGRDGGTPPLLSPTTGAYTVSLKTGAPRRATLALDAPDADGQYRFAIPAEGGAVVSWSVKPAGARPTSVSLVDSAGAKVDAPPNGLRVPAFRIPAGRPRGDYVLSLGWGVDRGRVTLVRGVVPAKGPKRRVATLSAAEPIVDTTSAGVCPAAAGPGAVVSVKAYAVVDANAQGGAVGLFLGRTPFTDVALSADGVTLTGKVPTGLEYGVYDVVVTSTSGQAAVRPAAFEILRPPLLSAVDPPLGPALGGFDVTLTGRDYRAGQMGVLMDGVLLPVSPTYQDGTTVRFTAPPHAPQSVTFQVIDIGAGQPSGQGVPFEYVSTPAIAKVTPSLVTILGGETVTLEGVYFSADDKVYVETTVHGVFENMAATQTTYVDNAHHRFVAPTRPKGAYLVYVEDSQGRPAVKRTKTLTYYSLVDATAASGLADVGDSLDGWTSAVGDFDKNGAADLFVSRRGGAAVATSSQTRVLKNDGAGRFTDVTASVMPAVGADDWRADRIVAADVDGDGYVDFVLTTNSKDVPAAGKSRTRILMNEARGGTGADAADRVLRDRTLTLMAAPRTANSPYLAPTYVADDWRGLDLWVGDLDTSKTDRPSIIITHDETKQELDVTCLPFCSTDPVSAIYTYGFYWGGSRAFTWDKQANGGLGKYKFERNFFPRKSGLRVPLASPGGANLPICNVGYGQPCAGKFTPFTGQRVAVGDLNGDGLLDVAVVSNVPLARIYPPSTTYTVISSLQVGIRKFNPWDGALLTDVTWVGGDFMGDAVAIGRTGFPDGNAYGTIAIARAAPNGTASTIRLVKFKPGVAPNPVAAFDEVTTLELPAPDATDQFQASQIAFVDVDQDGDQDLVLLANAAPGGTRSALRILRNETVGATSGVFVRSLDGILPPVAAGEHFEGDALAIGDVTGDGLLDYVVTRAVSSGVGTQTRIVRTDH